MSACRPACLLAALVLAGCGVGPRSPESLATTRDSAGIEIVEHVTDALTLAPAWTLGAEPAVRIGVLEGAEEYQFHNLLDARRLSDGRLAALDHGSKQVRLYDARGRFLGAQGREGGGPGEYQMPFSLGLLPGDSIAVFDPSASRTTVLDPDGVLARTVLLEKRFRNPSRPAGVLPDGRLVVVDRLLDISGTVMKPQYMDVWALAPDGVGADSLLRVRWGTLGVVDGDRGMVSGPLFGARGQLTVAGDRIVYGPADAYELREHGPDGALRRIVRWHGPDRVVGDGFAADYIEGVVAGFPPAQAEEQRGFLESLPVPAEHPAYDLLAAGPEGAVWVRAWAPPGTEEGRRWWVFDARGRLAGTVVAPRAFTPLDFGRDYLLGRYRDEVDVEYLALYALDR